MENVTETEEIVPVIIDLGANRRGELTEQTLMQLGADIKYMIGRMFTGAPINAMFKGTRSELAAFGKAMFREKKYMDSYLRYGLDDPRTYKDSYRLKSAVKNFEKATGLKWPFKYHPHLLLQVRQSFVVYCDIHLLCLSGSYIVYQ